MVWACVRNQSTHTYNDIPLQRCCVWKRWHVLQETLTKKIFMLVCRVFWLLVGIAVLTAFVCFLTQFRASTVQVLNSLFWQTVHMFELHARKAESIAGTKLVTLEEVVGDRMLVRLLAIKADSHPSVTHWTIGILEPCCQRECYRRSFLPAAIRLFHLSTYSPPSLPHLTVLCHFCTPWHVFASFYIYILIFLPFFSFY